MSTTDDRAIPDFQLEAQAEDLAADAAGKKKAGFLRRTLRDANNWRDLLRTPYGITPAALLGLAGFVQALDTAVIATAGPEIVRDLDTTVQSVNALAGIVAFFGVFAGLAVGYYADRHRRVPLLALGTIFSGFFSLVASRAQSLFSLLVPRVLDDLSGEASQVPSFSLLADYYPAEARGKVFALVGTLGNVARIVAAPLAGLFIVWWGWRTASFVLGLPLLLVGILILVILKEPVRGYMERRAMGAEEEAAVKEEEPKSFGEAWRSVIAVRTLRRIMVANVFLGMSSAFYGAYFGFFLAERYGLNALERGLLTIPASVLSLVGGYLGGGLVDSFTARRPGRMLQVVGGFLAIAAIGQLGNAAGPPVWVLVVLSGVVAFGGALIGPGLGVVAAQVIPPNVRTQGLQMFGLVSLIPIVIGTPAAAVIFTNYGYGVLWFSPPLLLIGAAVFATSGSFFELDMRNAFAAAVANDRWERARRDGDAKLLVCRSVDVAYEGVQVLFGVDLEVGEGEIVALLGTNGAGKSTLLRAICGTQEASGGAIVFDGRDVTHMPPHEIAARRIIHMPGGKGVFPGLSVRENLLLGRWLSHGDPAAPARLADVFEIFPVLRERADALAGSLSGGEQQQLSLAQAFLAEPKLLIIDELSLGLSPAVVDRLIEVVQEIHRRGVTVIVVEQSVNVALRLAERAVFMEKGEVRFDGRAEDLLSRPDILRAVYVTGSAGVGGGVTAGAVPGAAARRRATLAEARTVLAVDGLVKRYGGITAVDHVSFDLQEGQVLGLIGPNGAGKTTLFDLISGYQVPDEGTVQLQGVDITGLSAEERANRKLLRRFQDARLFPSLTVRETLLLALEQHHEARNAAVHILQAPAGRRAERRLRARADRLLELLALGDQRDTFIGELSTGLRRITDLACVLAAEPEVLLLDEPSSGVAQSEAEGFAPLIGRVKFETGCSILVIEHSMGLISAVSDELLALDQGAVVVRGAPADVLADDRVARAYLGSAAEAPPS